MGMKTAVRILLEAGADREKTFNGESAFSICCRRGFVDVMGELQAPCGSTSEATDEGKLSDFDTLQTLPKYLKRVLETDGNREGATVKGGTTNLSSCNRFLFKT